MQFYLSRNISVAQRARTQEFCREEHRSRHVPRTGDPCNNGYHDLGKRGAGKRGAFRHGRTRRYIPDTPFRELKTGVLFPHDPLGRETVDRCPDHSSIRFFHISYVKNWHGATGARGEYGYVIQLLKNYIQFNTQLQKFIKK